MAQNWMLACFGGWVWGCVLVVWCMARVPWIASDKPDCLALVEDIVAEIAVRGAV